MIIRTAILRDTDYSFLEISQNGTDEILHRKLEKGSTDYKNACSLFHRNNVDIKKGNSLCQQKEGKSFSKNR